MNLRSTVPTLREAARRAVAVSSLRSVAKDMGISPPGLRHFLDGGYPLPQTVRKLASWHLRQPTVSSLDMHEEVALSLLLSRVPEDEREATEKAMRRALARALKR